MLYLYHGDIQEATRAALRTAHALVQKSPDALLLRITAENFLETDITELLDSQGLFKSTYIIVLQDVLSAGCAEAKKKFLEHAREYAQSKHVVFVAEGKLPNTSMRAVEKHAEKSTSVVSKNTKNANAFNPFAASDALTARDKKKLWLTLHDAQQNGIPSEEMHGVLFWAVKSLLLAHGAKSAEDAGLKPYPFKKACTALKQFSLEEIITMAHTLARMPFTARAQNIPLAVHLERFALTL